MNGGPFVRPRRVTAPPVRLVVIPHAGGSGAAYYALGLGIPDTWEVLLLDLPGRGKRHATPALESMDALVEVVTDDLAPLADGTPLALFGHSLGAVVAFEVSRKLQARGVPLAWTGVSGRVAPDWGRPPGTLAAALSDEDMMAELDALGGLPDRIDELPEFREKFLALLRSDLRALDSFRPDPDAAPLAGPLTVFGAGDDVLAPPYALTAWARETRGAYRQRRYTGGHFHFLGAAFPPFAREIAQEIQHALKPRVLSSQS